MKILYIDPGTGSLLISALIGVGFTLIYFLKGLFYKITHLFLGKKDRNLPDFSGEIVFFSEGRGYWRVFRPVIEGLIRQGQKVIYLSADQNDEGISYNSDFLETYYLGEIKQAIFLLNRLKAKICVMTTPQLDVVSLKRSKNVQHYCHIIHSPTDIHAYKKFAFDYYDSVLCSSASQISNLKYLEKERNTKPKQIFKTGCTYYDVFTSDYKNGGDSILVAPTWGDRTFFKFCGDEILYRLLKDGHKVIFRPHPQSWISDRKLLDDLIVKFGTNTNFTIDKETSGENAISKSKVLICDVTSGMVFDMAFVYKKPVVAIEFEWADGGYEASDLISETAAYNLLEDIGAVVKCRNVQEISKIVNHAGKKVITEETINRHIFNFQHCGKIAAEQILTIIKKI